MIKLAFRGFRGFGLDSEFIELTDLTILTGKNGSGKSTFVKLLDLIASSFATISNVRDLAGLEIEIGNDNLGGKLNLVHKLDSNKASVIFETRSEFYTDLYEYHFNFDITDYKLKISTIDLFDQNSDTRVCRWDNRRIYINCEFFYSRYQEKAYQYNLIEEFEYYRDIEGINFNQNYKLRYYNPEEVNDFIENIRKHHISPREDDSHLHDLDISDESTPSHPFKVANPGDSGRYVVLDIPDENLTLDLNDIEELIREYGLIENISQLETVMSSKSDRFDFKKWLGKYYHNVIRDFSINHENKKYDAFSDFYYKLIKIDTTLGEFRDMFSEYELQELISSIIYQKMHILHPLVKVTTEIFEKTALSICTELSQFARFSIMKSVPSRSYNFFDSSNNFSIFFKGFGVMTEDQKLIQEAYLRKSVIKLEIADDIMISIQDSVGFLWLVRDSKRISMIDEGSGISNLISLLLFLASDLTIEEDDSFFETRPRSLLVLEEPETNLHPSLQSKLADVITDFISCSRSRLIIETHSEYFIRKLQYLVAKKQLDREKIRLYYFTMEYKADVRSIDYYRINIDNNGTLDKEFGSGFFDEADNIAIHLFKLNHGQKN